MKALPRGIAGVVLVALLVAACRSTGPTPRASEASTTGWTALAASPLTPRYGAHAFWTGREVIVLGGRDDRPCPPNADCVGPTEPALVDGAALDPATGTWRSIADAPVPIGHTTGVVVDGLLYLLVQQLGEPEPGPPAFLRYDVAADAWEELEAPPEADGISALVAIGPQVIAVRGSHEVDPRPDAMWDPSTDAWRDLPADPLAPSYDRVMVSTGPALVLLALPLARDPNGARPSLYRAAAFDPAAGTWRALPDSEVVGSSPTWFWAGGSIVNPAIGSLDGGATNGWGRSYAVGGILTPPAGEWSELPDPPAEQGGVRGVSTGGGEHVVNGDGLVLDVVERTWAVLPEPPDAADEGRAVAWAGDRLLVWGGVRWRDDRSELLDSGAAWRP